MILRLAVFSLAFIFLACSSNASFITSKNFDPSKLVDSNNKDPLNIGTTPTPPSKSLKPLNGKNNFDIAFNKVQAGDIKASNIKAKPQASNDILNKNDTARGPNMPVDPSNPFDDTKVFYNTPKDSEYVSIIGQNNALITIWALAAGNWVWGYSPLNSLSFGDARIWEIKTYPRDYVQIKNKKTNTCLSAYLNGVVHIPCQDTNQSQFWELIPYENKAVQIKNFNLGTCIQSKITKGDSFYALNLVPCTNKQDATMQWQIIAPAMSVKPLSF